MVDATGKQITNETARTPDNGNKPSPTRDDRHQRVIVSSRNKVPKTL
jgi:hypothetical protein